jgi:Ras-related protein Rap-1B
MLTPHRELYIKTGRGFLLVFSITSPSSLSELQELRSQILRIKGNTSVPIVLVGNKSDLEEDRAVSRGRAFQVSQQWGRVPYYETSARHRANVEEVFKDLCRQIIRNDMEDSAAAGASRNRVSYGDVQERSYGESSKNRRSTKHRVFQTPTPDSSGNSSGRAARVESSGRTRRKNRSHRPSCTIL